MSTEYDTVYLWVSSDDAMNAGDTVTNFTVQLQNRIDNPVSADLVEVVFTPTTTLPTVMFISSRALGQSTVSGSSTGAPRWWRAIPMPNTSNPGTLAFYNPRVEHTPVYQQFLQAIDIQITTAAGAVVNNVYFTNLAILVAVRVKRA